jgi:ERO1-like protein alpha
MDSACLEHVPLKSVKRFALRDIRSRRRRADSPFSPHQAEWKQIWEDEEDKEEPEFSRVNSFIDQDAVHKWTEGGDPWTNDMCTDEPDFHYIDLHRNPERFTGYSGPTATRIWAAIYGENCFTSGDADPTSSDICIEKRAFYRLISGLHTSITVHLAYDYLLDADKGIWGPNPELFHERVGEFPQRLKNMYFTYLFLLRATQKISPLLLDWDYHTPTTGEDAKVHDLIENMSKTITLTCPATFDETVMFKGPDSDALKKQFKARFRNISEVLDCVTCEKCRLWGKLQINGLGTALKILFELSESDLYARDSFVDFDPVLTAFVICRERAGPRMALQRTEIVALINTLNRLSESVHWSHEMHVLRLKKLADDAKKMQSTQASTRQDISENSSSLPVSQGKPPKKEANYFLVFGLLTPVFTLLLWALTIVRPRSS